MSRNSSTLQIWMSAGLLTMGLAMAGCDNNQGLTTPTVPSSVSPTYGLEVAGPLRVEVGAQTIYKGFDLATVFRFNLSGASTVRYQLNVPPTDQQTANPFSLTFPPYTGDRRIIVENVTTGTRDSADIDTVPLVGTWATVTGTSEVYTFTQARTCSNQVCQSTGPTFTGSVVINSGTTKGVADGILGPGLQVKFTRTDPNDAAKPVDGTVELEAKEWEHYFPGELSGVFHHNGRDEYLQLRICGYTFSPANCPK